MTGDLAQLLTRVQGAPPTSSCSTKGRSRRRSGCRPPAPGWKPWLRQRQSSRVYTGAFPQHLFLPEIVATRSQCKSRLGAGQCTRFCRVLQTDWFCGCRALPPIARWTYTSDVPLRQAKLQALLGPAACVALIGSAAVSLAGKSRGRCSTCAASVGGWRSPTRGAWDGAPHTSLVFTGPSPVQTEMNFNPNWTVVAYRRSRRQPEGSRSQHDYPVQRLLRRLSPADRSST